MTAIISPKALPDHTQLPDSDGAVVQNFQELPQSMLLADAIRPVLQKLHPDGHFCIGQDCGIYWRVTDPPLRGCVAPDWFYVPDVPPDLAGEPRRSYVLWQELIAPVIVLEYVSGDGSEERDRTPLEGKFWIYERRVRPDYYGIYEVDPGRIEMYRLTGGLFEPMVPNERGHFFIPKLGIELGLWQGIYFGLDLPWMRWYGADGVLLPTGDERADRYAERLRELGVDPNTV
jgi:Uma2 family endonuclease